MFSEHAGAVVGLSVLYMKRALFVSLLSPLVFTVSTVGLLLPVQAAAKPSVTDVGAGASLKEQTEPLLPSGKKSSPATGYVPESVLGKNEPFATPEQVRHFCDCGHAQLCAAVDAASYVLIVLEVASARVRRACCLV